VCTACVSNVGIRGGVGVGINLIHHNKWSHEIYTPVTAIIHWYILSILEICLLTNARRIATVIATSTCDTFLLSTSDFHDVLDDYPEMRARMERVAEERLNCIKKYRNRKGSVSPLMGSISDSAGHQEV
jgi:hypothetical protein